LAREKPSDVGEATAARRSVLQTGRLVVAVVPY
jgi:hypothetical protein